MALGNKFGKTFGSTLIVASLLAACNESNFQSETPTRPLKKSSNATPAVEDPADVTPTDPGKLPDSLAQLFPASTEKEGKFSFSLDLKNTQTSFQLVETTGAVNDQRTQIDRVQKTNSFTQGTEGQQVSQNFTQEGKKGLVDILVVIDNSGSMADEQAKLGTKMDALISSLNGVDWQIGVVTTSVLKKANGTTDCSMTLIKSSQADASTAFDRAIRAGVNGDGNEQGLKQAAIGLECQKFNTSSPTLVRANSTVAVLVVSDEDNCSDGVGPSNSCVNDASALETVVTANLKRTIGKNAGFFGLFTETLATCQANGQNSVGTKYIEFVKKHTKAGDKNFGDICAASYESTLKRISDSISLLLGNDFALTALPDAGSLVLSENGVAINSSRFTVNGQTISFFDGQQPGNNVQFVATYTVGKKLPLPSDNVTLDNIPAPETVVVRLTEGSSTRTISPSDYTVSGSTITFKSKLPALSTANVSYRVKQDLLTKFTLANSGVQASSIKVTVGGVATTAFSYNAGTNEVIFNQAPSDGASIVISYSFITGKQLTYALPLAAGARDIKILDGANELTFSQNGGNFTIGAADFVAGKTLVLQYEVPDSSERIFDLPEDPVAGSESLSVASGSCDLNNGIVIAGSKLVANCAVEAKTDFTLTYKYLEVQKVYSISGVSDPEKGVWVVSVDGEPTTNYTRSGSSITLNFEPPLDSKVDIRYTFPE